MTTLRTYTSDELAALIPLPSVDANKYSRGLVMALVGSARYPGAACLAACASERMGAGYTQVVTDPQVVPLVHAASASLVVRSTQGFISAQVPTIKPGKPAAVVVGSGFDTEDATTQTLTSTVLAHTQVPVLVDGGGLSALIGEEGRRLLRRRFIQDWPTVITPHAGEAARLAAPLNLPTDDPSRLSQLLALALGVTAVVKGPVTYLSDGEQVIRMAEGTPALAKAGTGDVLAGMIGALLAQGLAPLDACVLGATLHARAGRAAAQRLSEVCVIAEDVIANIPEAVQGLLLMRQNDVDEQPFS